MSGLAEHVARSVALGEGHVLVMPDGLHPCDVRARRAAMTDEEFWDDVFPMDDPPRFVDDGLPCDPIFVITVPACTECGETGPCATDAEGRPLYHLQKEDEG